VGQGMGFFDLLRSRYPNQPISQWAGVAPDGFTANDVRANGILGSIVIRPPHNFQ
jgi:hypothetical protein